MSNQLLDVQPRDLNFLFELKKQSSCSVRVLNKTDFLVAYKVKTTSPKKYCVRPNVGIVKPKSACEFIVTMQGQNSAPTDLICKDKFLVQSTIVPDGTTDEDVTSTMFVKDDSKHVEDIKLKVTLVSPHHLPELSPKKEVQLQVPAHEATPLEEDHVFDGIDIISKQNEKKNLEEVNLHNGHIIEEILPPSQINTEVVDIIEDVTIQNYKNSEDINVSQKEIIEVIAQKHRTDEEMNSRRNDSFGGISMQKDNTIRKITPATKHDREFKGLQKHSTREDINGWNNDTTGIISVQKERTNAGIMPPTKHKTENINIDSKVAPSTESVLKNSVVGAKAAEFGMKDVTDLELVKDIETMKSKLDGLKSKLREAEITISKLTEEKRLSSEEKESLKKEVVALKSRTVEGKRVQVGFPFLYVMVVAFISMVLGYRFRC